MKKRKNYILLLLLLCQTVVWAQGTDRVAAIREKLFNPDSKDVLVVSHRGVFVAHAGTFTLCLLRWLRLP